MRVVRLSKNRSNPLPNQTNDRKDYGRRNVGR